MGYRMWERTGYLERASRQSRTYNAVIGSLFLAAWSLFGAISFSSSTFALLDVGTSSISEAKPSTIIKRVTSRVPAVSSLLRKPSKTTPAPAPAPQPSATQQSGSTTAGSTRSEETSGVSKSSTGEKTSTIASPEIQQQNGTLGMLQFVGSPYGQGNGELTSVNTTQAGGTFAVLEPSAEGWRLFGVAWDWWLIVAAGITGLVMWREKLLQWADFGRERWQVLLSSKR